MIPAWDSTGLLPPGVHWAAWDEVVSRFGSTPRRRGLLSGLRRALHALRQAGCETAYIDGSFVTTKPNPGDFDACWSIRGVDPARLDPVLLNFDPGRTAQKTKYLGELFPAELPEGNTGKRWLEFFQNDRDTGMSKGIVAIDLRNLA